MARLFPFVLTLGILPGIVLCSDPIMLYSRQLHIPQDCERTCATVTPTLTSSKCPKEQCCTETFINALRDCYLCIGTDSGIQDYSQPQNSLDTFVSSCAAQGVPIPRVTLPGQDDNRSSSSFNPSTLAQPSTGSPTQSTTTPSTPTQSSSPQTTNGSKTPERWDINMKGLGMIVLGALARVAGVF